MNIPRPLAFPTLALAGLLLASPAASGEALRTGDRALPGREPGPELCFDAPPGTASVTVRHSGSWWVEEFPMVHTDALWRISVEALQWVHGNHEFKFIVDGAWEEGANRCAYVGPDGWRRRPPALYLTWQRDPTTTMTVHWHGDEAAEPSRVTYRPADGQPWLTTTGFSVNLPGTPRFVHTVELTGLAPGGNYEFRTEPDPAIHRFRTLPARLEKPLRFVEGGDVYEVRGLMDAMNRMVAARDPAFAVIGGDLAYANGSSNLVQRWYAYFTSFTENLIAPDGRIIPVIVAIGNHEVQNHYLENQTEYRPGPECREKVAPHFFKLFAFPGHPGYGVLDIGNYLSLVVLDTHHANSVDGEQLAWLKETLSTRTQVAHLFPIYHVPAYPSVRTPFDTRAMLIRHLWVPLFEEAGVRLAFEHHDHAFKVTHPMRGGKVDPQGIVFVGDGAWAVNTRIPNIHPEQATYLRKSVPINHVFEITLTPSNRVVRALDVTGTELDQFAQ